MKLSTLVAFASGMSKNEESEGILNAMTQLGDIIETRVTFFIQFSRKGANDWYRHSQWQGDTVEAAKGKLAEYAADLPKAYELRIVRETTIAEVVKS